MADSDNYRNCFCEMIELWSTLALYSQCTLMDAVTIVKPRKLGEQDYNPHRIWSQTLMKN